MCQPGRTSSRCSCTGDPFGHGGCRPKRALSGAALGAGSGALSGKLADYGIDDDFIRSLGGTIAPGTSALFVLVRKVNLDKVLPELQPFGGTLLRTSLSNEQEAKLKAALSDLNREREAVV